MKRKTHLLMGAAIVAPVAAALPPIGAVGAIWFGVAGGALPDYIDLRSEARRSLRHRGVSHSLLVVAAMTAFVWYVLDALSRESDQLLPVPNRFVDPWAAAIGLGMISHLLGDACTRAGIQPLLPLIRWKFWLLPRRLRVRSDGSLNLFAQGCSLAVLGVGLGYYIWSY